MVIEILIIVAVAAYLYDTVNFLRTSARDERTRQNDDICDRSLYP
jgi:hypothetical protein